MKLTFKYDLNKDVWCLLNKGKSSDNSPTPTKVYEQLVAFSGENPTEDDAKNFIQKYISENNIDIPGMIEKYKSEWENISERYQSIAEKVFGISLKDDVTVYLTVNNRCPYSIEENYFFLCLTTSGFETKICMHELWHFYTWYKFGVEWEEKIGAQKYNEIKESLTVLLNVECKELLPKDVYDRGYDQHQELRQKILQLWTEGKNIEEIWDYCVTR